MSFKCFSLKPLYSRASCANHINVNKVSNVYYVLIGLYEMWKNPVHLKAYCEHDVWFATWQCVWLCDSCRRRSELAQYLFQTFEVVDNCDVKGKLSTNKPPNCFKHMNGKVLTESWNWNENTWKKNNNKCHELRQAYFNSIY